MGAVVFGKSKLAVGKPRDTVFFPPWWRAGAKWAWDAKKARFAIAGKKASQAQALAVTRAGTSYMDNGSGVWAVVAANLLRVSPRGARVEAAGINRLRWSGDMMNAVWVPQGTATREATAIQTPAYGNYTRINRGSEAAAGLLILQNITTGIVVGNFYCAWCFVRGEGANIGKRVGLAIKRHAGPSTFAGSVVQITLTAEPQLVFTAFQTVTGNTGVAIVIHAGDNAATMADSVLVGCPQVDDGKLPTSPIETGAAGVTRAADAVSINLAQASSVEVKFADAMVPIHENNMVYRGYTYNLDQAPSALHALMRKYENSEVLRFTTKPGDKVSFDTADRMRSEATRGEGSSYAKGVSIFNAYQVKVDAGFQTSTDPSSWFIIGQWHGQSIVDGRSPYLYTCISGNDLVFMMRHWSGTGTPETELYRVPNFPREAWLDIIFEHMVHQTAGVVRIWYNGTKVVDRAPGPVGYWDHALAGYWKFGIYQKADTYSPSVEYQNVDEGLVDLSGRAAAPLAVDSGKQTFAATPSGGIWALDAAALKHPLIESITAMAE
jgi:hypothetical protein